MSDFGPTARVRGWPAIGTNLLPRICWLLRSHFSKTVQVILNVPRHYLSNMQLQAAEASIKVFCEERVPQHARSQVRLEYRVRGNSITLIERRVPWEDPIGKWTSLPIAKFSFDQQSNTWKLLRSDSNGRFHHFDPPMESPLIAKLIAFVDKDPTGTFWG